LPTPNPPATTIFTDVIAVSDTSLGATLELAKSTENPFKQVEIRTPMRVIDLVYSHESLDSHIRDQDPSHA
jgi:hypothetical protein